MSVTAESAKGAASTQQVIRTPWTEFWRKFKRQPVALAAGVFVVLLIVLAIVAPYVVPYDPENFFRVNQNIRPAGSA